MIRYGILFCAIVFSTHQIVSPLPGAVVVQDSKDGTDAKSEKYYQALRRRPNAGYLFDRFYNTWLDHASVEQLREKLTTQAEKSSATNDRLLLAFFHTRQGDDARALEQFREALKNDPGNAEVWYEKAVVESRTLDFETALADLAKAFDAKPPKELSNKIAQLRGKLFIRNRQNDQAIKIWQKLIADNPEDTWLVEEVIELQISEGLYDEAEKLATDLIGKTKDPYRKVMRQLRKGDIVQRSGRRDKALEIYQQSLAQVGNGTWLEREILGQIEEVFRREDNLLGLKEHYSKLVKADSKRLSLRQANAKLMLELGTFEDAVAEFKNIVDLTPGQRSTREAYIDALVKAEKFDLAVGQTESLIQQNADDPELQLKLARLHQKSQAADAPQQITKAIDQFVAVSENTEYAYLRAARLFDQYKDTANALRMFESCIAAFPESETATEALADHLYRSGKKEQAIEIWKSIAGDDCSRSKLVRVARLLAARQEHQASFDLMFARFEDFKLNPVYLGQLCTAAVALKKHEQAVPWALSRVRYSQTVLDLNSCMGQAIQVITKSEKLEETTRRLTANEKRTVSQTCLLAELLEVDQRDQLADQLIDKALQAAQDNPLSDAKSQQETIQMLASQQIRLFARRNDWTSAAKASIRQIGLAGGRKSNNVQQLIQFLLRDGELEQALTWVGEWKKISPGSLLPWFNESGILDRLGRTDDSIRVLRAATRKFPADTDLHMALADRHLGKGQYSEAERIYWRQYEESKTLADRMRWSRELATAAQEQGEIDELIRKLEERKKSNPQSIEPVLALAEAHRVADNYEGRRKALLEATRIQKDNLPLLQQIARLEESEGNWDKALETLRRADALDKTSSTKERMAALMIQYGEPDEGFNMLLEAAGGSTSGPRELEKIAAAIISAGEWDLARQFIQEHISKHSDDYRLKYLAAVTDEQLEYTSDAIDSFVELLRSSTEIAGLKKTPGYLESQMLELENTFPPDAYQFMLLSGTQSDAYDYLENRGYGFSPFASSQPGPSGISFSIPSSCAECHRMALIHLKTIADSLDEDTKAAIEESCRVAGFSNAKLIFALEGDITESVMQDPGALLAQYPDDTNLLALSALSTMRTGTMEPDQAVRGYRTFEKRYPELAFMFALQAAGADKSHHALLDEALEKQKKQNFKPGSASIAMVASYLSKGGMFGEASFEHQLSDSQKTLLAQKIRTWYLEAPASNMSPWTFQMIAQAVRSEPGGEAWIRLLDDEIKLSKKNPQSNASMFPSFGRGSSGLIEPLNFPPTLTDFPEHITSILNVTNDNQSFMPFSSDEQIDGEEWVEKYGPHIAKANNPILRGLLLWKKIQLDPANIDKPEEQAIKPLDEYLQQMLDSEKPSADIHLMAAGLACHMQQWNKANELLEKLRNLPLSRELRRTVDSALVAIATQGITDDLKAENNRNILASAKSAALRLRRGRLAQEQRMQLVEVFENLGLSKEAEKMENKLAATGSNSFGGMVGRMFSGSRSAPAPVDRIRKLVDSGKNDAAVRLLVNEFKGIAKTGLDLDQMSYGSYATGEFLSKVRSLGIEDEFLAKMDPGNDNSNTKLAIYGFALESFSKKEDAIKVYARVAENSKKDVAVKARLLMLELEKGTDITGRLAEFDAKAMSQVGPALLGNLDQNETSLESRFGLIKASVDHVLANKDSKEDHTWAVAMASSLADNVAIGGNEYLPNLYTLSGQKLNEEKLKEISKSKRKLFREMLPQRKQLHDESFLKLMEIPQLGPTAFTALLRSAEAGAEIDYDRFVTLAVNAATRFKAPKNNQASGGQFVQYAYSSGLQYNSDDEAPVSPARTPIEFLARHFGTMEAAQREQGLEPVYEKLSQSGNDTSLEQLKSIVGLYAASNEQFIDVARSTLESTATAARKKRAAPLVGIGKVIEVWREAKRDIDLDDFILEISSAKPSSSFSSGMMPMGMPGGSGGSLPTYLAALADTGDYQRAEALLERWAEKTLGSLQERRKLFENPNRMPTKKRMASQQFQSTLGAMGNGGGLSLIAARVAAESGVPLNQLNLEYQIANQFRSATDADKFLDQLRNCSSFVDDIATFDPIIDNDGDSMLGKVAESLRWEELEIADLLEKKFKDRKDDLTFGERIILRVVNGDNSKKGMAGLYETVALQFDQIQQLPAEQQQKLQAFIAEIGDNDSFSQGRNEFELSDAGKKVEKHYAALLGKSTGDQVAKLMAAKRFSDLKIDAYEFPEYLKRTLSRMDRSDTQQWIAAFDKGNSLMAKAGSNARSYLSQTAGQSEMIAGMINNRADITWFKLLHELIQREGGEELWVNTRISSELSSFLAKTYESASDNNRKGPAAAVAKLDATYRELGPQFDGSQTDVFIPAFFNFLNSALDTKELPMAIKWVQGETKNAKHPRLARSLELALMLAKTSDDYAQKTKGIDKNEPRGFERLETPTEYQSELVRILDGDDLQLGAKFGLAYYFLMWDTTLPTDCVWKCTDMIAQAYASKFTIEEYSETPVLARINDLSEQADFAEKAKPFADAWSKKYLKKRRNQYSSFYSSSDREDRVAHAVKLFQNLGNKNAVERVIASFPNRAKSRTTVATLITGGHHELARKLCNQMWNNPDELELDESSASFTAEVEQNLPGFVEQFGNPQTKLLGQAFIASLPDSKNKKKLPSQSLDQRLETLAETFNSTEFKSNMQRKLAVVLLARGKTTPDFIAAELKKIASELEPRNLYDENRNSEFKFNRALYAADLTQDLRRGNSELVIKRLDELNSIKPEDNAWSFERMMKEIVDSLGGPLQEQLEIASTDEAETLLPIFRKFGHPDYAEYGSEIPSLNLIAHVSTGQTAAYRQWIAELEKEHLANRDQEESDDDDEEDSFEPFSNTDVDDQWEIISNKLDLLNESTSAEKRLQQIHQIWELASISGFGVGSGHFQSGIKESCSGCRDGIMGLDAIKEAKLISSEEIANFGPTLAKTQSVNGEIWRQVAHEQIKLKQFEQAEVSLKAAVDACTKKMDQAKFNRLVEYAEVLVELGKEDLARKALESIDQDKLLAKNVGRYPKLKKKLSIK